MSLPSVINQAIENRLAGLHVALPGEIQTYDTATQKASVKPLLKREYRDGTDEELPVINNVPVILPGTTNAILSLPITKGDGCLLVFSERSLDVWLGKGGVVSPLDRRKHDLSDAVAIPGLFSFNKAGNAEPDSVVLKHGTAKLSLNKDNKIALGNEAGELLDLIEQILTGLEAALVTTSIGPQPLLNVTTFTAIKTTLAQLKGSL